jgi:hypothetical protein
MNTTSIGRIDVVIPEFDLSTVPLPWREDFDKLLKRVNDPRCYMTDRAAMALSCLIVSQKLSVPLSTILGSLKHESTKPRAIAYYMCETVLTWQDKTWISGYFKKAKNWNHILSQMYWSDRDRRIIRELSKEFRDILIKIYKSY